jgi:hypothetical protein
MKCNFHQIGNLDVDEICRAFRESDAHLSWPFVVPNKATASVQLRPQSDLAGGDLHKWLGGIGSANSAIGTGSPLQKTAKMKYQSMRDVLKKLEIEYRKKRERERL